MTVTTAIKKETKKTTKEMQRDDPDFLPSVYNMTKAKLSKLKKEYDIASMPKSLVKDDEGYELIHKKAMAIVKVRTNIEKRRKELTDDARKWTNKVNSEAKKFTEIVTEIEKPWKDKKNELDKAEEIKLEKERIAELDRTNAIELRVNAIINATANLVGANSDELRERLNLLNQIIVDESYDEYETTANEHKDSGIMLLSSALTERCAFEAQQLQMEKDRLEIEEGKIALAKAKKEIEDLQKDNLINSSSASGQKAVNEYVDKVVDNIHRHGSAHTFNQEPNHKDVGSNAEHPSSIESEDAEPYITSSEPQMVQAYAKKLLDVPVPDVGSESMVNLVTQMTTNLEKLKNFVLTNTQE